MLKRYIQSLSKEEVAEAIQMLERAYGTIQTRWIKGAYERGDGPLTLCDGRGWRQQKGYCAVGALRKAATSNNAYPDFLLGEESERVKLTCRLLAIYLTAQGLGADQLGIAWMECVRDAHMEPAAVNADRAIDAVINWNDSKERTQAEVLQAIAETLSALRAAQVSEVVAEPEIAPEIMVALGIV